MTKLPKHLIVSENRNSFGMPWGLIICQGHEVALFPEPDLGAADPDMGELPCFSLCVLLAAVWENHDPVVFPVLFLVKWS